MNAVNTLDRVNTGLYDLCKIAVLPLRTACLGFSQEKVGLET